MENKEGLNKKALLTAVCVGLVVAAGSASADGLDFSGVTGAISSTTVVAAITTLAVVKSAPGFARWAYSQVIRWFK